MAAGSKKVQTKKKTSTGRKPGRPAGSTVKKKPQNKYDNRILTEAVLLVVMALCIIFFLANFGVGGIVGKGISSFFFGLFGIIAYIFPIILFIAIMFGVSNKNNSVARIKIIASVFELIFICTLIQLISGNHASEWSLGQYYTESSAKKNGGGLFGGMLCKLFCTWFGVAGAYIFTIVLIIIAVVVITEKSFISGIKRGSKKVYDTAKNDVREYRADVAVRRKEKESIKPKDKVKGVTLNTRIDDISNNQEDTFYNFEKADVNEEAKEDVVPFDETKYTDVVDATEYAIRHFQDEQSMPFEPVYEEYEVIPKEEPEKQPQQMPQEKHMEDIPKSEEIEKELGIDLELINKELEHTKPVTVHQEKETIPHKNKPYRLPSPKLLKKAESKTGQGIVTGELAAISRKLQQTLASFGVKAAVTSYSCGPSVTRFELQPETGVRVSKIVSLADDIKLNLAAASIRIEAPIPGKSAVGIEVPNREKASVLLGDLVDSKAFRDEKSLLSFAIGKDVAGNIVMADIAKMPHVLVAGTTGSGKSVCLNSMILSILFRARPDEVKLILVDPKMVEFTAYNGIPHLLTPVVTDPKKAAAALSWAVAEMDKRYMAFSGMGTKDIEGYNEKIERLPEEERPEKMYKSVIIMDELADLMMVAGKEVESSIVRLAQKARACGIHLVLATQKPTVDVVTGLIKSNVPSRIALTVQSSMDSRVMLDETGADKLLGYGDMLYLPIGKSKPDRLQGPFVSEEEIEEVVDYIKSQSAETQYSEEVNNTLNNPGFAESQAFGPDASEQDQYFAEAGKFIIEKERASIGMLQRVFKIGFNRAARIMDQLGDAGVVGPEEGTKPRKVLMTMEQFNEYLNNNN